MENKYDNWKFSTVKWQIPNEGDTGLIKEVKSSQVLRPRDNTAVDLGEVIMAVSDDSQYDEWTRSNTTIDKYFTLQNPVSGRFLTSLPDGPRIAGKNSSPYL